MPKNDPFVRFAVTALYHFTDRRNLKSIRKLGGLFSLAKLEEMGVEIPAPGGNDWSHEADVRKGLDEYVHLCMRPNHPMEFVARRAGHIGDAAYLQIHPDVIYQEDVLFAPDVSNKSGVEVYSIDEARELIDFEVLYTRTDWRDPVIKRRLQQAEKCEILVPDHIPLKLIRNLPDG
jgi:hypothetical protein